MPQTNTKYARRILVLLMALAMTLAVFSGCSKQEEGDLAEGDGGFNLNYWLQNQANAMQFQYIAVFDYPDGWDDEPGTEPYFGADETGQQWILDTLEYVFFTPMDDEAVNAARPDFALAMNEPFLFFEFIDGALVAKEPAREGAGYSYYRALLKEYEQLPELQERIGEMRQAHNAQ